MVTDTKKSYTVSVVIPAYNSAKFIATAIESALNQSISSKEIIVIDDGSTDNTAKIVGSFGGAVKIISQKNMGVSAARNRGISESRSEFIAFLDSDDYFLFPDKLEVQIRIAQQKSCEIIMSGWMVVDENGNPIVERQPWNKVPVLDLFNWLRFQGVLPSAMLFKRSALCEVGGFNVEMSHAEDIDLILRMALEGFRTAWEKRISVAYRQHVGSLTRKLSEQSSSMDTLWSAFFDRDDLPFHIKKIANPIKFMSKIWIAFRAFEGGELQMMKEQLDSSKQFTNFTSDGLLWEWMHRFITFSIVETGKRLDVGELTETFEWKELETSILSKGALSGRSI